MDSDDATVETGGTDGDTRHDQRRRGILEAARLCFARSGFHGASMQEICGEAGMSAGALYRYFPSKEAIVMAIAQEERAEGLAILDRLDADESFVDVFVECGILFLKKKSKPHARQLMLEVCAASLRNSELGQLFSENECMARERLGAFIARAARRGEIPGDLDIPAALAVAFGVVEGLLIRMSLDPTLTFDRLRPLLRSVIMALFQPTTPSQLPEETR